MSPFNHQPIKRHDALAPLSRDHYASLVLAQHLIKSADVAGGSAQDRRKVVAEFLDSWGRDIQSHFEDEENLLLPLMAAVDRHRMLEDHGTIRNMVDQLGKLRKQIDPEASFLDKLGTTLDQHVRWEERDLFCRLQNNLTPEQLVELQKLTLILEDSRDRNVREKCNTPLAQEPGQSDQKKH